MCRNILKQILMVVIVAPPVYAEGLQVLGQKKISEAAFILSELGEQELAQELRAGLENSKSDTEFSAAEWRWSKDPKPYQYTSHAYGYIPADAAASSSPIAISDAGLIKADTSLKNAKVKITLDRLRVYDYPGTGVHHVLFDFFAQHQSKEIIEDVHFGQIYRAQEGQGAGVTGYPVFIGLKVGDEGVKFRCSTVNVKNEDDEKFLSFLEGDTFKNGLKLIESSNPLTPVVTDFATGIASSIASKNKNVAVQNFEMGLDFSSIRTRAKLREGSYIVVQAPDLVWDWSKWIFNPVTGQVVSKSDENKTIDLNYIVFSISKM